LDGCNNFTGGYQLEGATLALGPLANTKKACSPAIMDQEASFYEALGESRGYRFENGLLFLLDAQGGAHAALVPRPTCTQVGLFEERSAARKSG
jgi:heat shock protein HslJ